MSTINLEKIFEPKSIAVIGASDREGSVGYIIFNNLIGSGYNGVVFPINPKRESVQGVQAFKSINDVKVKVDMAIICTPATTVKALVEDCGKKGIKGMIIISAGFAEMGEEGKKELAEIERIRKKYGMRIIGPNCLGVVHPKNRMNASFAKNNVSLGKVAFISQSGALGTAVLDWALSNNIGFSNFVSLGSMVDVNFGDLIDYFGADSNTESIVMYVESITEARRFLSAAKGFAMNKPIIVVKAGRFAEGAAAAASHTGALAGEDDIYDAAFKRVGVIRVDEVQDLFHLSEQLAWQPKPEGNRLAIITNAGGPGVMAVDSIIGHEGKLAELSDKTMKKLNETMPPCWSRSNPVDILGDANAQRYAEALDICLNDPKIDGALVILTPQAMTESTKTAKLLAEKAQNKGKPILAVWMGTNLVREGKRVLRDAKIPCYSTPEAGVRAFMNMYKYTKHIELLYETPEDIEEEENIPVAKIKKDLKKIYKTGRIVLSETEAKSIFEEYGINTTAPKLAKTSDDAVKLAKDIGYPIVMKIQSEDISHKSDANCVMLNIKSDEDVKNKFDEIISNAKKYNKKANLDGVAVQKMVSGVGHEIIIGSKKDHLFGSVVLFGMGGIGVEAFKDRNVGIPPLNQTLAKRLIEGTKVCKFLKEGYRNIPPANMKLLEETLINFSQLLVDLPEIKEIDINPIKINDKEIVALDGRIILDEKYMKDPKNASDHLVISPYPKEFVSKKTIGGVDMTFRPIRPEDEPMWLEMFKSFSQESLRFRFFHIIKEMPHSKRIRYTFNDYDREIAIIPVTEENGKKKILGVARMTGDANHNHAEFAIILRDKWQSQGLGEELFDYLMDIAKKKGWKKMTALVLRDNTKMVRLFKKKGCSVTYDPDEDLEKVEYNL